MLSCYPAVDAKMALGRKSLRKVDLVQWCVNVVLKWMVEYKLMLLLITFMESQSEEGLGVG